MKIQSCKINHLTNPCGFRLQQVTASWVVDATTGKGGTMGNAVSQYQKAARICVALDEQMQDVVWDTGMQENLDNRATVLDIKLSPRTCYYWMVEVWGNAGDYAISDVNWFETGKMEELWQAKWITTPWEDKNLHPYFRGSFCITEEVEKARIYASGLGVYELKLNGKPVAEERLAPGCTAYDYWVQVQTYDVTELINKGDNAIGAMVGNGWAKGRFGNFPQIESPRTDVFSLILELHVILKSGEEIVIGTDSEWLCAPSPVLDDGIYDGEIYDARKEIAGWSKPFEAKGDEESWDHAIIWNREKEEEDKFPLKDRLSPKILVKETLKPIALLHTPKDEWVLDFGQNIAGWVRFHTGAAMDGGKAGTELKLTYGEVLQQDCFYTENLVTAKQEYHYICNGMNREVEP
ncbi:MAG: family 78 glycoside hydrolase catalytic domain, partial [Lachnospiraceae bacterium]|nr:family 78 glycoside hydrolase catalytic domain [Lachnospiraceae bacterium]